MKRKGWLIPIIVFVISFISLIFYQKSQSITTLADTTTIPPILWSKVPSEITAITFSQGDTTIKATYNDAIWMLEQPLTDKADSLYIYNIISLFKEPIFEAVIDTAPTALSTYGIQDTSPSITLYDKTGNEYKLIRGNSADSATDYVYAPISNTIYTLDKSVFKSVSNDPSYWRNKDLLCLDRANIKQIKLNVNHESHILVPSHTQDHVVMFSSNTLDTSFVNHFVSFLESSKIQKFITDTPTASILDAYGFTNPSMTTTITYNDGTSTTLTIGNIMKEENLCYVRLEGVNGIFGIPYFDLSALITSYETATH